MFEVFCFGEIGTLKNTHDIEIKDNVTPLVTSIRKIPLALKPKLKKEIKSLADLNIIQPVQKLTDWVKGYLHYKTITSQNVSLEAQVKTFYFVENLCSVLKIFLSFHIFNHHMIYHICDVTMSISK